MPRGPWADGQAPRLTAHLGRVCRFIIHTWDSTASGPGCPNEGTKMFEVVEVFLQKCKRDVLGA